MSSRYVHPTGLWIYAGTGAVAAPTESVAVLRRCGAVLAIAMVRGVTPDGDRPLPSSTVARFVDTCRASDVDVILCSFPAVSLGEDHLLRCRDELADLAEHLHCRPQLDAEPDEDERGTLVHWTPDLLQPWRHINELSLTTTAAEAPHLGRFDGLLLGQLEQPESFDALDRKLEKFVACSALDDVVLVSGAFDIGRRVRTPAMMRRDQERAVSQAKRAGAFACWDVRALAKSTAKCDALRDGALAMF